MTDTDVDPVEPSDEVVDAVNELREATRAEHDAAVDALVEPLEQALVDALDRVWATAMARVGLVAAASPDDLGSITGEWSEAVREITPYVGEVYGAGALGAWQQHAAAAALAEGDPVLDPRGAVDLGAVDRMSEARNRMVGIGDAAWADARATLARSIDEGWDVERTTREMQARLGVHEGRARTVARTEVVGAANAGSLDGVRALGRYGPRIKEWMASMDSRTRDSHYLADGQRRARDAPFSVGGSALQYPGDPAGPARETVNCRCTILWVESGTEVLPPGDGGGPGVDEIGDPSDPAPPLPPTPEPDPPRFLTPEEQLRADVAEFRATMDRDIEDAYQRLLDDVSGGDAVVRRRVESVLDDATGGTGMRRLSVPDIAEGPDGGPSALLVEIEERVTEFGRRVDSMIDDRLAARGLARPPGLLSDADLDALRDRRSAILREQDVIYDDVLRQIEADPEWAARSVTDQRVEAIKRQRADERWKALDDEDIRLMHEIVGGNDERLQALYEYRDEWSAEYRRLLDDVGGTGRSPAFAEAPPPRTLMSGGAEAHGEHLLSLQRRFAADVADAYPAEWVRLSDEFGPLHLVKASDGRAFAWTGSQGGDSWGVIAMDPSRVRTPRWVETAVHEFGHRMEQVVPGLRPLEFAFYRRRTAGEALVRMSDVNPGKSYKRGEITRPDEFANPYSGKQYEGNSQGSWELFTMAAQTYASPSVDGFVWSEWGARQFLDDDYRRWFLGSVLSAG